MSTTGLSVFDNTLHKTNIYLNDIMRELGSENRHEAYIALRAVLHALRDRLTVEEATDLGAQLPIMVRGIYYEDWNPSGKPVKERHKEEFINHVENILSGTAMSSDGERAVRSVFATLSKRVTEGEIQEVKQMLPEDIRSLWQD
ncbi:MAG: DUF2267 domain-containing protein [Dehalococcoidia bacterium]